MKVRLLKPCDTTDGPKPAGHIIDHKDAHWLVRMGIAEEVIEPVAPASDSQAESQSADVAPQPPTEQNAPSETEAPQGAGQVVTEAPPVAEGSATDDQPAE